MRDITRRAFLEPGTTVGGSLSLGMATFNYTPGDGVAMTPNLIPQYGASVDVTMKGRAPEVGETVMTGSLGASEHTGISLSSTGDIGISVGVGVSLKGVPVNLTAAQNPKPVTLPNIPAIVPDNSRVTPRPQP